MAFIDPFATTQAAPVVKTAAPASGGFKDPFATPTTPIQSTTKTPTHGTVSTKFIDPFLGGGAYESAQGEPNKVVNTGHTSYGGETAQTGQERDDIVPVSLGGANANPKNMRMEPLLNPNAPFSASNETATDPIEKQAAADYKSGKLSLPEARLKVLSAKQTQEMESQGVTQDVWKNFLPAVGNTLGDFAKSLAQPFVGFGVSALNLARNVGSVASGIINNKNTFTDYSGTTYNLPVYGEASPIITGHENPLDAAKKVTGTALQIAANFVGGGELKAAESVTAPLLGKAVGNLSKDEAMNMAKTILTTAFKRGFPIGAMFGGGSSLAEGGNTTDIIKNTLLGGLVGTGFEAALLPFSLRAGYNKAMGGDGKIPDISTNSSDPSIKYQAVDKGQLKTATGDTLLSKVETNRITGDTTIKYDSSLKANHPKLLDVIENAHNKIIDLRANPEASKTGMEHVLSSFEKENGLSKAEAAQIMTDSSKNKAILNHTIDPEVDKVGINHETMVRDVIDEAQKQPIPTESIINKDNLVKVKPVPEYKPIEQQEFKSPEIKTSKLAQGVEEKAISKKLSDGFEGLPEYAKVNVKDQASAANQIVKTRLNNAIEIAMGRQKPPEGVLPESVFVAVENHAQKTGDVDLLRRLATESSQSLEATGMGQRIRMLAERNPESATGHIKTLSEARKSAVERNLKKQGKTLESAKADIIKQVKAEISNAKPKFKNWSDFIESVKC